MTDLLLSPMGIRGERHEARAGEGVDDALDVLAVARDPGDRLGAFGGDDGAEDLPAGARQVLAGDQPIAGGEHEARHAEEIQDESGSSAPTGSPPPRAVGRWAIMRVASLS
jgi:hypothetical protein